MTNSWWSSEGKTFCLGVLQCCMAFTWRGRGWLSRWYSVRLRRLHRHFALLELVSLISLMLKKKKKKKKKKNSQKKRLISEWHQRINARQVNDMSIKYICQQPVELEFWFRKVIFFFFWIETKLNIESIE
jgi:hypothetical protein